MRSKLLSRIFRNKLAMVGAGAGALILTVGTGSPAQAVTYPFHVNCDVFGAHGDAWFNWPSSSHVDMKLKVADTVADGHHVAVRFISHNRSTNTDKAWAWHHLYTGKDTQQTWTTYANDSGGHLNAIGFQIAVMEGSEQIGNCQQMVQ
jgi:hypothetical protein